MKRKHEDNEEVALLPLISNEEFDAWLDPVNPFMTRLYISPACISSVRWQRHQFSITLLKILYQTGATLINQGCAYGDQVPFLCINGQIKNIANMTFLTTRQSEKVTKKLLKEYDDIATDNFARGSNRSQNVCKTLFVLRVALDHFPIHTICNWTREASKINLEMSISSDTVDFPNDSCFVNDHSALWLLQTYIKNSPRFQFVEEDFGVPENYMVFAANPGNSLFECIFTKDLQSLLGQDARDINGQPRKSRRRLDNEMTTFSLGGNPFWEKQVPVEKVCDVAAGPGLDRSDSFADSVLNSDSFPSTLPH